MFETQYLREKISLKVILHIGTEKTGTSSIQHFLHLNRRRLPKYGFHLLKSAGDYDQRALSAFTRSNKETDYYFKEQGINSDKEKDKFRADLEQAIDEELTSLPASIHSVIISSEHFHSALRTDEAMSRLQTLLEKYFEEVKVICYLREQGAMCTSWYSTALKSGLCRTQKTFIERQCRPQNYYFNFWDLLSRWGGTFGQEALDIGIYDKSEFRNGDLLEDFIGRVDPALLGQLDSYTLQANQSLSPEGQRLLLAVNCAFLRTKKNVEELRVLCREEIYKLLKGRGQQLDVATRESIYQSFRECNSAVQREYFPHRKELFPEPNQILVDHKFFSEEGQRALDEVMKVIIVHGERFLNGQDVEEAKHQIRELYLGNIGIPFDWDKVHLFGKGILQVGADGMLQVSIVIRNTSSEQLEFSKKSKNAHSIGWQAQNTSENELFDLRGTVEFEQTIPAGAFRMVSIAFHLDHKIAAAEKAVSVEFCIVDNGTWMNQEHPLNSAWSALFLPN
jgi:hypothetical protein